MSASTVIFYTSIVTETPSPPSTIDITSTAEPFSSTTTTPTLQTTAVEIFGVIEPNGSTSFGTTQIVIATSTAPGKHDTSSTDTGVIIGATVGVILGFLLLCGLVFLLFLRKRRAKKRELETQDTTQDGHGPAEAEKAHLHSDEVKPIRMELEGDVSDEKTKRIGEVMEMPANELVEAKKELPANEIVGIEMDTARTNRFTNDGPVKRKDLPLSFGPVETYQANKSKSVKTFILSTLTDKFWVAKLAAFISVARNRVVM